MNDLDLIRRITRDLWFWQGLRFAPAGIVLAIAGTSWSGMWPASVPEEVPVLVGIGVAGIGYRAASRYYARTMGEVRPDLSLTRVRSQVKWFVVYPAMVASLVFDGLAASPIFVSGPVWAASLLLYRLSTGGGREHYLVLAAITAMLGILPLIDSSLAGAGSFGIFFTWFGIVYVVGGILDHVALTRALPARTA